MRGATLPGTLVICTAVAGALFLSSCTIPPRDHDDNSKKAIPYNPYPPGILPSNLVSAIERVRREVTSIENEALAEWHALPPPTLTGQPPTLQGTGMRANQLFGKLSHFYHTISPSTINSSVLSPLPS